jgi:hypothetical protein
MPSLLGTLLIDLLTAEEEAVDRARAYLRFNIGPLAERLIRAADWLRRIEGSRHLHIGPANRANQHKEGGLKCCQ